MENITTDSNIVTHIPSILSGFFSCLSAIFIYLVHREVNRDKENKILTEKIDVDYKKGIDDKIQLLWKRYDASAESLHSIELMLAKMETKFDILFKEHEEQRSNCFIMDDTKK